MGGPVWVVRSHPETGEDSYLEAELLSVAEGAVVRIGDRIETAPPGRIAFPGLPEGLRERPTLVSSEPERKLFNLNGYGVLARHKGRVENGFFRYKSVLGGALRARNGDAQKREAMIGCQILNRMAELGKPQSYAVAS